MWWARPAWRPSITGRLDLAAHHAVIVQAGNMSLGVNLLTRLTHKVAPALDADWDIEVVEAHHRRKVDAPSGTALMLGQAAAEGRGMALDEARVSARDGITGARERGTIGFSAIRGGDIVGEHDVIFAADGERVDPAACGDGPGGLCPRRAAGGAVGAGAEARAL